MKAALKGGCLPKGFRPLSEVSPIYVGKRIDPSEGMPLPAPSCIMTGKINQDGSTEIRKDAAVREKASRDGSIGQLNIEKSKKHAREMINKGKGRKITPPQKPPIKPTFAERMLNLVSMEHELDNIHANLLEKSGLRRNRAERDFNLLEEVVSEAARHLREDELDSALDNHFGMDHLDKNERKKQADGCTVAALLLMNAAMLHQRIAKGQWLPGISDMSDMRARPDVFKVITRQWHRIAEYDFRPIITPALQVTETIDDTGKLGGLERALRHIAVEAERIAESYADMGADHAGPLFNKVMGAQASDGAYFTRPPAASLCARLALDALGEHDWSNPETWRKYKVLDPACGSGTMLAAVLTEMKQRAESVGVDGARIAELQKLVVEEMISGLDINPVSLQLAAAQLTAGNKEIRYRTMGLHLMPYGPDRDSPEQVGIGTLELLGQKTVFPRDGELNFNDPAIASKRLSMEKVPAEMEDAVNAVRDIGIVIMNPPFSNRAKMAGKFSQSVKEAMRARMDNFLRSVVADSPDMAVFINQNSIAPSFVALAEKCLNRNNGVLAMITPTIALTTPSVADERSFLSKAFHIDMVLSSHRPGDINLSQSTTIGESIIVARRHQGPRPPTRFIALDQLPKDETEVAQLHEFLRSVRIGSIPHGWGEVSEWPAERISAGDWTPVMFRSPVLAEAAFKITGDRSFPHLKIVGNTPDATGQVLRGRFRPVSVEEAGSFPILKSKGADGQTRIEARPDEVWVAKNHSNAEDEARKMLEKTGHLLVTTGQRLSTARLVAVASDRKYVGNSWMPVSGLNIEESKAAAVFLNSTVGRIQFVRIAGRSPDFPNYSAEGVAEVRVPDIRKADICQHLAKCWEQTRHIKVPQFRDGECEVRRRWDDSVAEALGWDVEQLTEWRHLLHREPHVRGMGYNDCSNFIEE